MKGGSLHHGRRIAVQATAAEEGRVTSQRERPEQPPESQQSMQRLCNPLIKAQLLDTFCPPEGLQRENAYIL